MELDDNQRIVQEVGEEHQTHTWPALVGRRILDITGVVEAEARLMRASIEPTLTSVLDRWLWQLVSAAIALIGCLLLIGAVILLIHIWLALWLALAITGAATILLALCGLLIR
jgi:hypothetical protein